MALHKGKHHARSFFMYLLNRGKGILGQPTYGAYPILGDILPRSAGSNAAIGIALSRIVDVSAGAFVLSHGKSLLIFKKCLLAEVTVQQAFESLAMASLITSHLMHGVVNGI